MYRLLVLDSTAAQTDSVDRSVSNNKGSAYAATDFCPAAAAAIMCHTHVLSHNPKKVNIPNIIDAV
jgi:hypothetical protein